MPHRTAYPRSSARPIYLTVSVLGLLGLAGVIVMLIAMADVPRQSYYLLITAFGLLTVALAGLPYRTGRFFHLLICTTGS